MNNNSKSPHILNASSNLVGFCFVVLTSIRILNLSHKTLIDDITTFSLISFLVSSIFSFLAIRNDVKRVSVYENIAEWSFVAGLFLIFFTALMLAFNFID